MSTNKNHTFIRHIDETDHTTGDYKLQDTAPHDVSCAILIGKSDKRTMINKCLKKRKELLVA